MKIPFFYLRSPECSRLAAKSAALLLVLCVVCFAQQKRQTAFAANQTTPENQVGPQPPCGHEPVPPYPPLDQPATVKSWDRNTVGRTWKPAACTHWSEDGFTSLITISARFRFKGGTDGLLRHFGAISQMVGMPYWSTTHKRWRTLITEAHALSDAQPAHRRPDFTPDEATAGKVFYFEQVDNLSGRAVYRLQVLELSPDRLVLEVENVGLIRFHFLPIFHPGDLQTICFLDRESNDRESSGVWRYYGMMRMGKRASSLVATNESSSINRAVAFYRYAVGIPGTQEPPVAR
jgi:hypothetical protein